MSGAVRAEGGAVLVLEECQISSYSGHCIVVKGDVDGSGLFSEHWLVENSTAAGAGLSVGSTPSPADSNARHVEVAQLVAAHDRDCLHRSRHALIPYLLP